MKDSFMLTEILEHIVDGCCTAVHRNDQQRSQATEPSRPDRRCAVQLPTVTATHPRPLPPTSVAFEAVRSSGASAHTLPETLGRPTVAELSAALHQLF